MQTIFIIIPYIVEKFKRLPQNFAGAVQILDIDFREYSFVFFYKFRNAHYFGKSISVKNSTISHIDFLILLW